MATTKLSQEVLDLNPGNPDYILDSTNAVTVINAGGNQYNFNGVYGKFGAKIGTITLTGVPSGHPIAFINSGKTSQISYTGTVNEGTATGPDGNTYTFYSGTVTLTVSADFGTISYYCKIHGYMGGQDNLVYTYSDSALKMPSGTELNRPTAVAGQIRNNTNETSAGSASCMEYYKSSAWQKINNVAPPPPAFNYSTVLYTGTGSSNAITGVGFKPDLVIIKNRDATDDWAWFDSTRGANVLSSNSTASQTSFTFTFDTDGFTVPSSSGMTNGNGVSYVAWCMKANGGTTSSNTDGTITSTVQASDGMSIVTWTGDGNGSSTVGHGLGATPELIILKDYSNTRDWQVYASGAGSTYKFGGNLNLGSAWNTSAGTNGAFDTPSSTVINFSNGSSSIDNLNASGANIVAYCFTSVTGKMATSSYTGDGNSTGPTISTGFEPNFLLVRRVETGDSWRILDSARSTSNPRNDYLDPNSTAAEASSVFSNVDFNSTDFQIKNLGSTYNNNGGLYMYWAIN